LRETGEKTNTGNGTKGKREKRAPVGRVEMVINFRELIQIRSTNRKKIGNKCETKRVDSLSGFFKGLRNLVGNTPDEN